MPLLLLLIIQGMVSAASALDNVKEYRLENGLKVIIAEDHKAPVATFQVWYRVGSRNEKTSKTGISHLLEHMMFKGTQRYGSKVFSRLVQKNGGIDNAYTTRDYTAYFQVLSSDRIDLSVELESDRMHNLLLNPDDAKYERSVVMEERRMRYEDDPQRSLYEDVVATALKIHPYRNPVIGWMSEIASIKQDDLLHYYKRYYSPDNAVVIVAGDVNPEDMFEKVRKKFGDITPGNLKEEVASVEPPQKGEKRLVLRKEARLPYILIAYHVPVFPGEDALALEVLSSILSGKSGRLYENLVRKGIALNVFSSYDSLYIDPFLFVLGGTPAIGRETGELEAALYAEIERLKGEGPTEREVQKSKNQVESTFIMGQDSVSSQARLIGAFEVMGDWRMMDRYLEGIRNVTTEDVKRVAGKYFTEDNRTVGILIPE